MPKARELCRVTLGGRAYETWEAVRVTLDFSDQSVRSCQLSVTEKTDINAVWASMQFSPGDECTVELAGYLVLSGRVIARQAAYDAAHHGVMLEIQSRGKDYVDSTVDRKKSQFRNQNFEDIAKQMLDPFGLKLVIINPSRTAGKKFKDINASPGETVHEFVEYLARSRGMFVTDNEHGDVVAGTASGQATGLLLEEGVNIKTANATIRDDFVFSRISAVGQQRGDDKTWSKESSEPAAQIPGGSKRYRPLDLLAEIPMDAEDLAARVEHERNIYLGNTIEAQIQVFGWLKPDGSGLWKVGETHSVKSPMLLLNHDLAVQTVVFTQDATGTNTMLTLKRPEALGAIAKTGVQANPDARLLPDVAPEAQALP